uniref:DNA-directed DNA polymerase n=1 Tax=viral metagenome TaxID=1070528 RepID=A0A6H1ZD77_9ZZZZ
MEYIPLHRKYRPQRFEDICGQRITAILTQKVVFSDKIPNAFLFAGVRGTGKTSLARIIAKALNCKSPIDNNPCNTCSTCLSITNSTYPDVVEMDAGSNSSIDQIRELIQNAAYGAKYGKYKIYLLDEAHNLSQKAWDALLKTIEEPATSVRFIFCTTEILKVPETIKSRSQIYYFNSIKSESICNRLEYVVEQEAIQIDKEIIEYIADKANGSMRDALILLEQLYLLDDSEINDIFLMNIGESEIINFLNTILSCDYKRANTFIDSLRVPPESFIDSLSKYLCGLFTKENELFARLDYEQWIKILEIVADWKVRFPKAVDRKLSGELVIIRLIDAVRAARKDKKEIIEDPMLQSVKKICERLQGTHKKLDDKHYIVTSKLGNEMNIVENVKQVSSGYYCIYPTDTKKLLESNELISTLLRKGVVQKK